MSAPETIELMDLPRNHLSHSGSWTYRYCPARYEFSYVLGIAANISGSMLIGVVSHQAWAYAGREYLRTGVRPRTEKLYEYVGDEVVPDEIAKQKKKGVKVEYQGLDTRRNITATCQSLVVGYENKIGHALKLVAVEKEWTIGFKGLNWHLTGRLDNKTIYNRIIDQKTTARAMPIWAAKTSGQLTGYQIGEETDGGKVRGLELHVAVRGKHGVRLQILTAPPRTKAQKDDYLLNEAKVVKDIRTGIFPKVNDPQRCVRCPYFRICKPDWFKAVKGTAAEEA